MLELKGGRNCPCNCIAPFFRDRAPSNFRVRFLREREELPVCVKSRGGTGGGSCIGVVGSDTQHRDIFSFFAAVTALSGTFPKDNVFRRGGTRDIVIDLGYFGGRAEEQTSSYSV